MEGEVGAAQIELVVGFGHLQQLGKTSRQLRHDDGQTQESSPDEGDSLKDVRPDHRLEPSQDGVGGDQEPRDDDDHGQ